jgi:hypothetical protein
VRRSGRIDRWCSREGAVRVVLHRALARISELIEDEAD